jgi:thiol-disulfide isomerase/thioredoxin
VTGSVWVASYVILWVTVVLLCFTVVVLLRQIGILHTRVRPVGVHHGGEGLEAGVPAPPVPATDYAAAELTLVVFTSPTCTLCRELLPSIAALERDYDDVAVSVVSHSPASAPVFTAFNVYSTPYVVAVDADGVVRGGGVANTLEQIEELIGGVRSG